MRGEPAPRARFRPVSLDALNFLLADVRAALGPYLNVFLVTQQGWSQSSVGLVTAIAGLVGLAAHRIGCLAVGANQLEAQVPTKARVRTIDMIGRSCYACEPWLAVQDGGDSLNG